jgi:hypothetical protein
MREEVNLVPAERIERCIVELRGHKVMLDKDLAELYSAPTSHLKRAVKRNLARFPNGFMFQVTHEEYQSLRCQIGILDIGRGRYSKYLP